MTIRPNTKIIAWVVAITNASTGICQDQSLPGWRHFYSVDRPTSIADAGTKIWVSSKDGVVEYDKTTGRTRNFRHWNTGWPLDEVEQVCTAGGRVYALVDEGIFQYDQQEWTAFDWASTESFNVAPNGDLWVVGTPGLRRWNGSNWTTFDNNDIGISSPATHIRDLDFDAQGNLWIAAFEGLLKFDGVEWDLWEDTTSLMFSGALKYVAVGSSGVWVCNDYGLQWFDGVTFSDPYTCGNSPVPTMFATDMDVSPDGTLWISFESGWNGACITQPGGVVSLKDGIFTRYEPPQIPTDDTKFLSVLADNEGIVWAASQYGDLCRFDGLTWSRHRLGTVPSSTSLGRSMCRDDQGSVFAVVENANAIWSVWKLSSDTAWTELYADDRPITDIAATGNGHILLRQRDRILELIDGVPGTFCTIDVPDSCSLLLEEIELDHTGTNVWYDALGYDWCYSEGVVRSDGSATTMWSHQNSALPLGSIYDISLDSTDHVWAATSLGLASFDGNDWVLTGPFTQFGNMQVFGVTAIAPSDVWAKTPNGYWHFDGSTWAFTYPAAEGVQPVLVDPYPQSRSWLRSNWTLYEISPTDTTQLTGPISLLSHSQSQTIVQAVVDGHGDLWLETWQGFYFYGTDHLPEEPVEINVPDATAFPNPSTGAISFTLEIPLGASGEVLLFDGAGRRVFEVLNISGTGERVRIDADITALAAGVYLVVLRSDEARLFARIVKY